MDKPNMGTNGQSAQQAAPPMPLNISQKLKLMMIRIGDEKRDDVFLHIDVLKKRIIGQDTWIEDTEEVIHTVLSKVIQNLPHKVFIYGALIGLVAKDNADICKKIVNSVATTVISESLFKQQDAFSVRNFARWLGYLVHLRVVSPAAVLTFFVDLIGQVESSNNGFQQDVLLDCILTFLLCQDTKQQLQNSCSADFAAFMNKLSQIMEARLKFEMSYRKLMGFPEQLFDTQRTKWMILTHQTTQNSVYELSEIYLMIKKDEQQQVIDALSGKPAVVNELPKLSFEHFCQPMQINFDEHLDGKLTPARYVPLSLDMGINTEINNQSSEEQTHQFFVKFMTVNLFADMMIAYQHDHKMATNDILNMYRTEFMEQDECQVYYECFMLALFSNILNHKESASDHRILISTNFPNQSLFYFQIMSKVIAAHQDPNGMKSPTGMTAEKLQSALDNKMVEYVQRFDFNTSGAGKLLHTIVKFSVFLQGQQAKKLINENLIKSIKSLSEQAGDMQTKYNKFLHLYLTFACQLCYHKPVQEALDQEMHDLLPNQDQLKAKFQYVMSKDKRQQDDDQEDEMKEAAQVDDQQAIIKQDVELIMDALSKKGEDSIQQLKDLFNDGGKIKSEGMVLKQIIIEVLFLKYGSQSLEHVSRGIERIRPVLEQQFKNQAEAQKHAIYTVFKAFSVDQLSAQNFDKENIYHVRAKVVNLVEKLSSSGIFDSGYIIEWCIEQLSAHCKPDQGNLDLDFVHCYVVINQLKKTFSSRSNVIHQYIQDKNKISEVKIETPHEKRLRQQREQEAGADDAGMKGEEEPKQKSQQQIQEEEQEVRQKYEELYAKAVADEQILVDQTLKLIDSKSEGGILLPLREKVQLLCGQF